MVLGGPYKVLGMYARPDSSGRQNIGDHIKEHVASS